MDPHLKCFVDEAGMEIPPEWGLPTPNAGASYKSLAKYGKNLLPMSNTMVAAMNLAWEYTSRHFGLYMANSRVLDYEEAKTHLDMSTSSGAPFNQQYPVKKDLFEQDPDIDNWLQADWNLMGSDPNWTCLFTNSLKEELRLDEKMRENSIRTFLSGGVDAVVHGTRLFVDMNEKMYNSHLQSSSAVGMSPYKGNWDRLYCKLKTFKKGYALDESQYDSSLRSYMMWGCARYRWNMLQEADQTEENKLRIQTYYRNLVHTLVICPDGVIVMKQTGNPSGSVNTISDNTLILYTLLAYAWVLNAPEEMRSYLDFELHTAKALVGDDNTWTVSDEAHKFFNAVTVIEQWKKIGITTTTDSMEPRKPEELDFLSAHTVFLAGKAVPVYDRVKLMTSLLYAPREHHTPATTLERTAAMLSVGWTDLPFRRFCRDAISWLLDEYDPVLFDEPRWILAKCQIQTDDRYRKLFLGESVCLAPQSFSGARVKLIQPEKNAMNSVKPKGTGRNPGRKQRKPNGGKGRKGPQSQVTQQKKKQRRRGPRNVAAKGSTLTGQRAKRTCVIEEDEFIAAVLGSVAFTNTAYSINPGQAATFPWLSRQAAQWEKYHFERLEFYYKRDVSEFATNGTTGKVMMSVDFDASDPPPASKQQIEDTDPRVDGMPCENNRLVLAAKDLHSLFPVLYVRTGGLPGSSDIKTYDVGNFNIATQGNQNASEIGELRVRYRVRFSVPVLENLTSPKTNHSVWSATTYGAMLIEVIPYSTITPVIYNGQILNGLGLVETAVPGVFTFPSAGNYLVDWDTHFEWSGGSTSHTFAAMTTYINGAQQFPGSSNTFAAGTINDISMSISGEFYSISTGDTISFVVEGDGTVGEGSLNVVSNARIVSV